MTQASIILFLCVLVFCTMFVLWEVNEVAHGMTDRQRLRASLFACIIFASIMVAGLWYATLP